MCRNSFFQRPIESFDVPVDLRAVQRRLFVLDALVTEVLTKFLPKLCAIIRGNVLWYAPSRPDCFQEVDNVFRIYFASHTDFRPFAVFVDKHDEEALVVRCCLKLAADVKLETFSRVGWCVCDLLWWLRRCCGFAGEHAGFAALDKVFHIGVDLWPPD